MAQWMFPKRLAAKKRRWFASIFGKNTWRFGPKVCASTFEDRTSVEPYQILWASEHSAVVLFKHKEADSCHHLFFDGDHFFLVDGRAGNLEYFKRMPSNRSLNRTRASEARAG